MPIGPVNPGGTAPISPGGAPSLSERLARLRASFPAQGDDTGLTGTMPGTFERIESGEPMFDPSSQRFAPVPPQSQMSRSQFASAYAPGPGAIGGGIEGTAGLPFSAQVGLGTGKGAGGGTPAAGGVAPASIGPVGSPSSVVERMLGDTMGGPGGPSLGGPSPHAAVGIDPLGRSTVGPTNVSGPRGLYQGPNPGSTTSADPDVSLGGPLAGGGPSGPAGTNLSAAQEALAAGKAALAAGDYQRAMSMLDYADRLAGGNLEQSGGSGGGGDYSGGGGGDYGRDRG